MITPAVSISSASQRVAESERLKARTEMTAVDRICGVQRGRAGEADLELIQDLIRGCGQVREADIAAR